MKEGGREERREGWKEGEMKGGKWKGGREGGWEGAVDQIGGDVHEGPGNTCHAVKPVCNRVGKSKVGAELERDGMERKGRGGCRTRRNRCRKM